MRQIKLFGAALIVLLAAYASAADMPAGVQTRKADSGKTVLADAKGMTLYTYDKDTEGKSNCNGNCAKNWPPLMAEGNAMSMGDWTVVTRDDGMKQWAYKGKALYTWAKDTKPGDTTGDGVGNAWHIAMP
jgi:predicted lipoprotein with Yx(FWY)xxD motif